MIPAGTIVMWYGSVATIPSGWRLCNGTGGTPNLRDRFIVGAGTSYGLGAVGGLNTVALTTAQMPAHSHPITGDIFSGNGTFNGMTPRTTSGNFYTINNTTGIVGGGQAHENRPPYFALYYIMKV
jgi:microcystin-dependent protein